MCFYLSEQTRLPEYPAQTLQSFKGLWAIIIIIILLKQVQLSVDFIKTQFSGFFSPEELKVWAELHQMFDRF